MQQRGKANENIIQAEHSAIKAIRNQALRLNCYCEVIGTHASAKFNWWPDGSLKFNVLEDAGEYVELPKGMYFVNCYGFNIRYKEDTSKPRPPHPSKEQIKYNVWIEEMRRLYQERWEKGTEERKRKEEAEAAKMRKELALIAELNNSSQTGTERLKIKNEIALLVKEKNMRTEPVINIRTPQTLGCTKE